MNKSPRQELLEEAIKITTSDRNKSYGNPEDNFTNIANLWNAYFRAKLAQGKFGEDNIWVNNADVAQMMILMKIARLATNPGHRDSALDVAGYAACLADIQVGINAKNERSPATTELNKIQATHASEIKSY
jgi:Domain of unknown function (DUF6378)